MGTKISGSPVRSASAYFGPTARSSRQRAIHHRTSSRSASCAGITASSSTSAVIHACPASTALARSSWVASSAAGGGRLARAFRQAASAASMNPRSPMTAGMIVGRVRDEPSDPYDEPDADDGPDHDPSPPTRPTGRDGRGCGVGTCRNATTHVPMNVDRSAKDLDVHPNGDFGGSGPSSTGRRTRRGKRMAATGLGPALDGCPSPACETTGRVPSACPARG
jgi:hypothetical protein